MLALTRRLGETIIINGEIKATILGIKDNQVKIGILAPKKIKIYREEIHQKTQRQTRRSKLSINKEG
jgi:carbon storage regulator